MALTQSQISEVVRIADDTLDDIRRWEVHPEIAARYALINGLFEVIGGRPAPAIISGLRTPERNREIGGATNSNHLPGPITGLGRAIDLDNRNSNDLELFGLLWEAFGGRWGRVFNFRGKPDLNHFDIPGLN